MIDRVFNAEVKKSSHTITFCADQITTIPNRSAQ